MRHTQQVARYWATDNKGRNIEAKVIELPEERNANTQDFWAEIEELRHTFKLLQQAGGHRNVVRFAYISETESRLNLLYEYCPAGSIWHRYTTPDRAPIPDADARRYTRHILNGLVWVHSHDVVHGSLKCLNVVLSNSGVAKLTDFGAVPEPHPVDYPRCTAPLWIAPETLHDHVRTKPVGFPGHDLF